MRNDVHDATSRRIGRGRRLLGAFILLAFSASIVEARVSSVTRLESFPVRGRTPAAVLKDFARNGPVVSGSHAFARTRMASQVIATFVRRGRACRVRSVSIEVEFRIKLPRAEDYARFSPDLKHEWRAFRRRLLRHERQHRRIWIGCLKDLDRRLRRLTAPDCRTLRSRMNRLHAASEKRCDAAHARFDRKERHRVRALPFIRRALPRRVSLRRRK